MTDSVFLMRVVICTLAFVICSVICVFLDGLFTPAVDNKEIFAILSPAFQTIVGCFVGFLGGQMMGKDKGG